MVDLHFKIIFNESYKLFITQIYQDIIQRLNCQSTELLSFYLCLSIILRSICSSTICIFNNNNNVYFRYNTTIISYYKSINSILYNIIIKIILIYWTTSIPSITEAITEPITP